MTNLDLYKFITENSIEYHWHDDDVIMFIPNLLINDFNELLGSDIMDDEGIECHMKYEYFYFFMEDICGYFGIELTEIFKPE